MKNKGITLVALIITIIVLLILATISISLVINNNILDKAQHGVDKYSEEEELEQIKLAVASAMLKGNGFLDNENLNAELQDRFQKGAEQIGNSKRWNIKLDKNYTIYENGNVAENESLLPAEYQQVEYIESTGMQYIDTGYMINESFKYKLKYAITDRRTSDQIWPNLMGAYGISNASDNKNYSIFYSPSNKLTGGARNKDKNHVRVNYELNEIITIEYKLGKTLINENEYENSKTWNGIPYSTVCLFNVRSSNEGINPSFAAIARIYYAQIYNGESLVRDFVPCHRILDDKPGVYDLVEDKFYTNQGTGDDFIAGPEV